MERSIVTTCLVGCLTLGFLCLFSVYLPTRLSQAKGPLQTAPLKMESSPSLSEIVNQIDTTPQPVLDEDNGTDGNSDDNNGNDMIVTSAKHHHYSKKTYLKPASEEMAKHYPLKMYEPLEEAPQRHARNEFAVSNSLKMPFEFWRNVYARYELNKTILHDNRYLDIVYGVLDFSNLDENLTWSQDEKRKIRQSIEEEKKEELKAMLTQFDRGALPHTAGEHIVYSLFNDFSGPHKFREAAERVRSQWGQKDRFMAGLKRAGRYMPMMEEIFIREGVPKEITRLVFVESMFTLSALSKVGAAGPWQFMPATARYYMTMNDFVDERRDPLIAAQAAARLLLKNFGFVQSWPLAINGYNTGILRMVKAEERLRTRDIGAIIQKFEDAGYQFASRNFYPEFLAALEVADHYKDYFGALEMDTPVPSDEIVLPYPASFDDLAKTTATDVNILKDLNPAYYEESFAPHAVVPKGYTVRVPYQQKMVFLATLDQIQAREKQVHWHIVGKGETLKTIAARYQLPAVLLKETNGLIDNRIRKGQPLKIPSAPTKVVLEVQ